MDPLVIAAVATFAGVAVTALANVVVGRMNVKVEKTKSAEDAADQVLQQERQVHQQRLEFKDEQVVFWKSRYEACMKEQHHDG